MSDGKRRGRDQDGHGTRTDATPGRARRGGRGGRRTRPDGTADLAALARRADARRAVDVPPIVYPEQLPVSARREEIAAAIRDHQVVIVSGETGSGKTTQLPKIALELGRGREGQIGHTQPRRIAARTVAERISEEITGRTDALGEIVGYQVRFTDESSTGTLVKVMTDGILLAQIQRDPMLRAYDTLIIDEAHERSLNIDFVLGYLSRLLPRRPDLKLVITSATIDSARFAEHFRSAPTPEHPEGAPAPVVEVTGRTFPVEVRYRPPGEDEDPMTALCAAVDELVAQGPGDVLCFFSGEREIRDAADALASHLGPRAQDLRRPDAVELLPLYGRLSAAEQHRVFEAHGTRRLVLATNVAETSLTVPGIRFVVDTGTARISRYSKGTKVQRLPIEPISQASANQRSGRCGRVADGVAIRLYSEEDYLSRPEFTEPEILRTSLASVILQMIAVRVASSPEDVAAFPFVDPPDVRAVRDGVMLLRELGAIETTQTETDDPEATARTRTRLTSTGRALAQLPMDPRLARMVIEGSRRGVAREVMIIAAALSIQDPRERPAEHREAADQQHARFADPTSDFLSYLNLWEHVRTQQRDLSGSAFRRMCKAEHLSWLRLREWQDVVAQLRETAKPLGMTVNARAAQVTSTETRIERRGASGAAARAVEVERDAADLRLTWDADRIHQSLLAGLLSQLGMQEATEVRKGAGDRRDKASAQGRARPRNEYLGARGARFAIFPGSGLAKRPPAWVMAGELVETSRLWARDVARIQPEWAEEIGAHLVRRTYSDPAWSTKQGAATALERVLLHGLPIVTGRKVLFAKVDPVHAREMFLRHALVEGEWTTHHRFFHDNRALLAEASDLQARARRHDLVVDDDVLYAFYDARVPADVVSARHFDQWWKTARRTDPELLTFTPEMLAPERDAVSAEDFPTSWPHGDLELPLTYQFSPGTAADGVTVHVPVVALNRVRPEGFDRMVPGLRLELLTAAIRALPKPVRVQLVPAPDVAAQVAAWLDEHEASWADTVRAADAAPSLRESFSRAVRALRDVDVPDDAWDAERLPAHLRMTFRVVEERGTGAVVLGEGKDLLDLQRRLARHTEDAVRVAVRGAVRAAMEEAGAAAPGTSAPAPGEAATPAALAHRTGGSAARASQAEATALAGWVDRSGLTTWPDGLPDDALPAELLAPDPAPGSSPTALPAGTVLGYPALVPTPPPSTRDSSASTREMSPKTRDSSAKARVRSTSARVSSPSMTADLRVVADPALRDRHHAAAIHTLLLGETALATGRVTSRWSGTEALTLAASPYPSTEALVADVQRAVVESLVPDAARIRDGRAYRAARDLVRSRLEDEVHRAVGQTAAALAEARTLDALVRSSTSLALLDTLTDVRAQQARLVHDGFVREAGVGATGHLLHLPRYLRAAARRIERAADDPRRDASLVHEVHVLEDAFHDAVRGDAARRPAGDQDPGPDPRLDEVRWMLEELRVSLFAQQLGTTGPVSAKRVRTSLAAVGTGA